MMYLLVQRSDVMASCQTLQSRWHSMQMSRYSVSFESCIVSFCRVQDLIPRSNIVHLTLHMKGHLSHDSSMPIKGHGRPALESFWNLAFHLYYMPTFGPVFPRVLAAWFARFASCSPKIAGSQFPCLVLQHGCRRSLVFRPCPRC